MDFPKQILGLIQDKEIKEITDFHVSGDRVFSVSNEFILKISNDIDRLKKEYEKDKYFSNVLPTPKPLAFIIEDGKAYYLRSYIQGEVLCSEKYLSKPPLLMKLLKEALDLFHEKSINDCPYVVGDGNTLIHGDFCLPNILVKDNNVVGFIDIGDAGVGDVWYDYAWCIWSFEYNLKTNKYTKELLDLFGIEFNQEKFEKYTKD